MSANKIIFLIILIKFDKDMDNASTFLDLQDLMGVSLSINFKQPFSIIFINFLQKLKKT